MNKVVRNNIYQSDVRLVTHKQYKKKWRNIINRYRYNLWTQILFMMKLLL